MAIQQEMALDETDRRLIELLRANGRLPAAKLAATLSVSRGTVQNRIDRLVGAGIIAGFTIRLRSDVETGLVRAQIALEVRSSDIKPVVAQLKRLPEAVRIYSTNGRWDLVAEIQTRDLAGLDAVITRIRQVPGVSHSETSIYLTEL